MESSTRSLQSLVQPGAVDGDRGYAADRIQKFQPFLISVDVGAMKQLEGADHLALRDQWDGAIGLESLAGEERTPVGVGNWIDRVKHFDAPVTDRAAGQTFVQGQPVI